MNGFKLFQMDVKSAFLNGIVNEEIYDSQPPGFEDHQYSNHVYNLMKALYGLKQAPRQWYERLSCFLLSRQYERGKIDKTLFIKKSDSAVILVQIYVDDIIFGSSNEKLCEDFVKAMQGEFDMSMMGELSFFLGSKSSNPKKASLYVNPSIIVTYSRNLKWRVVKMQQLQCQQIVT